MSVNSQILNIIHDIEELNEETTAINENIVTINGTLENLEDKKQDNINVTDTIQISKLKTQYITMTLTGQDLETALGNKQNKITDNSYLSISDISGLSTALENVDVGEITLTDVTGLETALGNKQNKITRYYDDWNIKVVRKVFIIK